VVPILGDSVVAFFGLPVAHEDDPIRAVRAAVELRTAANALSRTSEFTLSPKSGIETGVIIVGGADDIAYGSLVTTAARLQQAAADGDVLVGAVTQRLIRGVVVVKPADDIAVNGLGLGGSVALWRVLEVVPQAAALVRRFDTPMRGRQAEVTQLRTLFQRTARSGAACRVTVLGEAGIGKSRVAEEIRRNTRYRRSA
jgi:class 3 adenylate cyclase